MHITLKAIITFVTIAPVTASAMNDARTLLLKIGAHQKKSSTQLSRKLSSQCPQKPLRVASIINIIKKYGPLDPKIGKITYAPNYPLREARTDVFETTPDGQTKNTHSFIRVTDTKWSYDRTFRVVTLREGTCTKNNCTQQTVGRISDINTLKVATPIVDPEQQEAETKYGIIKPQISESVAADLATGCAGVLSACDYCEKIELIFPESEITDSESDKTAEKMKKILENAKYCCHPGI